MTRDEIVVTEQFLKYERKLFKEYRKTVRRIECPLSDQSYGAIDTNMTADQNFLMTRLPIMDYSF